MSLRALQFEVQPNGVTMKPNGVTTKAVVSWCIDLLKAYAVWCISLLVAGAVVAILGTVLSFLWGVYIPFFWSLVIFIGVFMLLRLSLRRKT